MCVYRHQVLRELLKRIETDWDSVRADFEHMRATLLSGSTLASFTADEETLAVARAPVQRLLDAVTDSTCTCVSCRGEAGCHPSLDWWFGCVQSTHQRLLVRPGIGHRRKATSLAPRSWCPHR